jgi:hypothetical protein
MLIELDKTAFMSMVKGTYPYYSIFDHPVVKKCGIYIGGMLEEWRWNRNELEKLSEEELYELYNLCINSYK